MWVIFPRTRRLMRLVALLLATAAATAVAAVSPIAPGLANLDWHDTVLQEVADLTNPAPAWINGTVFRAGMLGGMNRCPAGKTQHETLKTFVLVLSRFSTARSPNANNTGLPLISDSFFFFQLDR